MRVLFLNLPSPPGRNIERDFAGGFGVVGSLSRRKRYGHDLDKGILLPPLMEGYAASVLEKNGHESVILDCQLLSWGISETLKYLADKDFDVIVARICLPSFDEDLIFLDQIADLMGENATFVAWGAIVSVRPEEALSRNIDFVLGGEIEYQLSELVENLANGVEPIEVPYSKSGLLKMKEEHRPNPDLLPSPLYEKIQMRGYYDNNKIEMKSDGRGRLFFTILSSRGCPYGCSYCPYMVEYGRSWRSMSPQKTVDEIEKLVDGWGVEAIWFRDPTWNIDTKRSTEICEEMISRDLRVMWRAEMRADLITEGLAKAMKEAGCVNAQVGLETGDPSLLSNRGKKGANLLQIKRGIAALRRSNIPFTVNLMVGLPGDSWSSIHKTANLVSEIGPYRKNVAHIVPYPGTPFQKELEANGCLNSSDWKEYASGETVVNYPNFSKKQIMMAKRYLLDYDRPKEKYRRLARNLMEFQVSRVKQDLEWIARSKMVSHRVSQAGEDH